MKEIIEKMAAKGGDELQMSKSGKAMRIVTNKKKLAIQLAGKLPAGAKIIGMISNYLGRNREVLIQHKTGAYTTMLAGVSRSIDPALVRAALRKELQ